jgi:hypothetical protein
MTVFPELILASFNDYKSRTVLYVVGFYVLSQGVIVVFSSYLRGRLLFKYVSLLNIILLSLIPVAFVFFSNDVFDYFLYTSIASLLSLTIIIIIEFFNGEN